MLRTRTVMAMGLAVALALGAGRAGAAGDKPGVGPAEPGSKAAAQQKANEEYVARATAGDLFEVETGKLAVRHAASASVKQFGRMMIQDHSASTDKIRQAAAKTMGDKVPTAQMTIHQQAATRRLMEAEGRQFDRLYVEVQTEAHREALQLHRAYAASGGDPVLQQAAKEIVPVLEKHLSELRRISNTVIGLN